MSDGITSDGDRAGEGAADDGRRRFIRRLPWVAPAIQTFLVSEEGLAQGQGQTRRQRVSPNPGQDRKPTQTPPPPPPPPPQSGGE